MSPELGGELPGGLALHRGLGARSPAGGPLPLLEHVLDPAPQPLLLGECAGVLWGPGQPVMAQGQPVLLRPHLALPPSLQHSSCPWSGAARRPAAALLERWGEGTTWQLPLVTAATAAPYSTRQPIHSLTDVWVWCVK